MTGQTGRVASGLPLYLAVKNVLRVADHGLYIRKGLLRCGRPNLQHDSSKCSHAPYRDTSHTGLAPALENPLSHRD
jgi:hypothetical protein